jgi:predicted site-specific integrase-resolvase
MKLSEWAKKNNVCYKTAWRHFKDGKLPCSYRLFGDKGAIRVDEEKEEAQKIDDYIIVYARVSSSENKSNLDSQAQRICDFCAAKGWVVKEVIKECASGLNDNRPKLLKIFSDNKATKIVVEHKDRLTRFGYGYIKALFPGEVFIINEAQNDKQDLMQDFISLVTSFCARIYGKRRSRRNTEKLIEELNQNEG